jgi:AraC family transcriptional regulator
MTLLLGGEYSEHIEGRWHDRPVNAVAIRPAHAPHADRIGAAGARFLVVELSADLVARRSDAARPLGEWALVRTPSLAAIGWRLLAALRRPAPADDVIDGYVAALIADLTPERRSSRKPPLWLATALEMIHDRHADRLTVDELARESGVHPAHLARVFRRHLGQTIGTYVRAVRLSDAMRRLARRDRTAAAAGLDAGFHDQSHFTRWMREVTGLTPGQYRRVAGSPATAVDSR